MTGNKTEYYGESVLFCSVRENEIPMRFDKKQSQFVTND